MASVELNNVTKVYDKKVRAVCNANLNIEDKEFVVLVGPSGCGKSTLLRMVAGLEEITEGQILIDGRIINDIPPKDRDIAMVFQNYALYPHMTVYDNMAFGLKLRKFPKAEIKKRVDEAAKILHIQDYLERKPKALSGGQRQRVAVGRAIVRDPKVFLFDEPLSNLDAKLRVQMRIEINRLYNKLQTTMIYVTHDQVEAMTMGSKIVVLNEGYIQQVDTPLNLYNNPQNKFVAAFIGSPSMNFFNGRLSGSDTLIFQSEEFNVDLSPQISKKLQEFSDRDIILGVRPEDIVDAKNAQFKNKSTPQKITVDVVEPVGNEIFIYFGKRNLSYCMRIPSDRIYKVEEKVDVVLNMDKIYFFDSKTEERVY